MHAFQLIIKAEREAIGHIENRWPIVLARVQALGIGIGERIVLGLGASVRSIEEAAREMPSHVKEHGVVIAIAVIVRVE